MDPVNAFIGRKTPPSEAETETCLGPALPVWNELLTWLKSRGIRAAEWKSASAKYDWGLRPALKDRTILYLGPCQGCFRVSFVLGDKAVASALAGALPKAVKNNIAQAKRYGEGTGVLLFVHSAADLAPVITLVEIKLKN
jgi:hypothetical protein